MSGEKERPGMELPVENSAIEIFRKVVDNSVLWKTGRLCPVSFGNDLKGFQPLPGGPGGI